MATIRKFVVVGPDGHLKLDMPVQSYAEGARDLLAFASRPNNFAFLSPGEATRLGWERTGGSIPSAIKMFNERKSA